MRAVATIICVLFISGCGGLIINREDSAGAKIAKFTTRTVLGIATLGESEQRVSNAKAERDLKEYLATLPPEEREYEKLLHSLVSDESRRSYIRSLPPEQRIQLTNQIILERERQKTAEIRGRSMGRAIGRAIPKTEVKVITPAPIHRSTNCYTTYIGNSAHTTCN